MNAQVAVTYRTTGTLQAAIAGHVSVPGEVGYDQARQAWNLASGQRPSVVVSAQSPTDVMHAAQFAHAHGMRTAMPGTLRYHSISCACEHCIRVDERIPSVSPPVTVAFDADELCGYREVRKFMDVALRCGFGKATQASTTTTDTVWSSDKPACWNDRQGDHVLTQPNQRPSRAQPRR